jgi:hypothetical protein
MSDPVAVALAYSLPPTFMSFTLGLINLWHIRHVRHSMNSLLDQRVADARTIGHSEGRREVQGEKG